LIDHLKTRVVSLELDRDEEIRQAVDKKARVVEA